VLPLFLARVVQSLGNGGDSDNFRTMQRALQIFKNKKILNLIKIHGAESSKRNNNSSVDIYDDSGNDINDNNNDNGNNNDKSSNINTNNNSNKNVKNDTNDNNNNNDDDNIKVSQNTNDCYKANEQQPSSLDTVLMALIPSLFRGGNLSWNPTVNKMTGIYMYIYIHAYSFIYIYACT
jgi:hypothetical protein